MSRGPPDRDATQRHPVCSAHAIYTRHEADPQIAAAVDLRADVAGPDRTGRTDGVVVASLNRHLLWQCGQRPPLY
jgi:hypothetical protein